MGTESSLKAKIPHYPLWALGHKTTYEPMIYASLFVMNFDECRSITWARGRGLGPGYLKFFGPQMALAYRLDAISQGQKNSRFPGPIPLPLALVMDLHASKTSRTYKS